MSNDHDVYFTKQRIEYVYIHIHKHNDNRCYWLGEADHSGKLQIFSDVIYAKAFGLATLFEDMLQFTYSHPEVAFIKSWEARSELFLSPAMRKVLRV